MESWQKIYILEILPELLKETKVNAEITDVLISEEVLNNSDVEKLDAVGDKDCSTAKAKVLYDHLIIQTNGYKAIGKATYQAKQSGAFLLLLEGLVKHLLQESNINLDEETLDEIFEATSFTDDALQFFNAKVYNGTLYEENWISPPYPLYLPRYISNRIRLEQEVFEKECSDIFIFTGITRQDLSNLAAPNLTATSDDVIYKCITTVRFVLLKNEGDWDKLRGVWSEPVHLIQFDSHSGDYILQRSTLASKVVTGHVPPNLRDKSLYIPEDQFLTHLDDWKNQGTICICDTPGMGKTLLLENLARQARQRNSNRIVAVIGLQKFVQQTHTSLQNNSMNPSESIHILLRYLWPFRLMSTLSERALENNQLQLQLFLDGFDEIPKEYLQPTLHLFASIAENEKNVNLFVTSRPHMRSELEETFQAVAYDILPFSEENQVDFLVKFWQKFAQNSMDLLPEKLKSFASKCLKTLKNSLTHEESNIMGIPLLCYMLAAVTLTDAELSCHRDSTDTTNEHISSISLYDVYEFYFKMGFNRPVGILGNITVETKPPRNQNPFFKTYFGKVLTKLNIIKTTSTSNCTEQQKLRVFHTWKALQLLVPELADDYRQSEGISDLESERILACGILQNSSSDSSSYTGMTFLHRTFAEYLVAEHISEIITTEHTSMNDEMLKKYFDSLLNQILATEFSGEDHRFYRTMIRNPTSEVKTDIYTFMNPTVVYFLNASLQNKTVVPSNVVPKILMKLLTNESLPTILFSCIAPSYSNIIQYFKQLLKSTTRYKPSEKELLRELLIYPETLIECTDECTPDNYYLSICAYLCHAAKTSNVRVLEELYSLFEECLHENLHEFCSKIPKDLVTPLHCAVERLDYTLVEFFTRQITPSARGILLYLPEHDDFDGQKIIEICELLFMNDNLIFSEQIEYEYSLGYCTYSIITKVRGLNLIKFLVQHGADINASHKDISNPLWVREDDGKETGDNILTINVDRMDDVEFCELCRYLIHEIKAYKLFTKNLPSWDDPLPRIVTKIDGEILSSILQIPKIKFDGQDNKGNNWVLACIQKNRELGFVENLLDLGCEKLAKNNNGESALHLAVKSGNVDTVEYLLAIGFCLECKDKFWNTSLFHALPNLEMTKYLVQKNANVLAVNTDGDNIAHLAVRPFEAAKAADIELSVEYLLSLNRGAKLFKTTNKKGKTPLDELVGRWGFPSDTDTVELLLKKSGVDLNVVNIETGDTMFMIGLKQRDSVPHLQSFMKYGANPHNVIGGTSAIHISAGLGHLESVKYLVAIGVSLELEDCSGNTPILVAAKFKQVDMMKYLISQDVNVLKVNYDGDNIAHLLLRLKLFEKSQKEYVDYLMTLPQAPELFKMTNNKGECPSQIYNDHKKSPLYDKVPESLLQMFTNSEQYLPDNFSPSNSTDYATLFSAIKDSFHNPNLK